MSRPSDDLSEILLTARDWLADGHRVAIATVIETWGSAPRPVGSHLVVRDDGLFEGSVSGGCVEGDVIVTAQELIRSGQFRRIDYGVANERAWEVGLACGGRISILVQPVAPGFFDPELLERLAECRRLGRPVTISTDLVSGRSLEGESAGPDRFVNVYRPPLRLAIVGAVHIAQALCQLARPLGYELMLVDPRGLFASAERFPDVEVRDCWPDEALAEWGLNSATAVVTLTHDPKLDDPALISALGSDCFYIAALGSKRTHAARLERLESAGFSAADLQRIHGPAGLAIGARSPSEIAVSILAEMIQVMHGGERQP